MEAARFLALLLQKIGPGWPFSIGLAAIALLLIVRNFNSSKTVRWHCRNAAIKLYFIAVGWVPIYYVLSFILGLR